MNEDIYGYIFMIGFGLLAFKMFIETYLEEKKSKEIRRELKKIREEGNSEEAREQLFQKHYGGRRNVR
jgi:hypothetical protein